MKFKDFIDLHENINDKNLFKAVWLTGGGGSGKSFIADLMFKGEGVYTADSDYMTEFIFKKEGLPLVFDKNDEVTIKKQFERRWFAKGLANKKLKFALDGMLPIVLVGTGRNPDLVERQYRSLKNIGYDRSMIFVEVPLEIALERNQQRNRKVPDDVLIKAWYDSHDNIPIFRSIFGNSFRIINNEKVLVGDDLNQFHTYMRKEAIKILKEPLKNKRGIKTLQILRDVKGKYISDINQERLDRYNVSV